MEVCFSRQLQLALRICKPQYAGSWSGHKLYSQYPKHYEEARVINEDLEKKFKEFSEIELKAKKFKAVESDQTCSIFYDEDVNKITKYVMKGGKKELARRLIEEGFTMVKHIQLRKYNNEKDEVAKSEICLDPLKIFHDAIVNVTPKIITKNLKKSGRWYKIPCGIQEQKARLLGMKWIVEVCRDKGTKDHFNKAFANEIIMAAKNEGKAVNKKLEMHKQCEANRSYAHYRWG